jgi:hypothetical protein
MKPDASYAVVPALLDNPEPDIRRCCDHDTVQRSWNGADVGVTRGALYLSGVWVDGKHLVPSAPHHPEQEYAFPNADPRCRPTQSDVDV